MKEEKIKGEIEKYLTDFILTESQLVSVEVNSKYVVVCFSSKGVYLNFFQVKTWEDKWEMILDSVSVRDSVLSLIFVRNKEGSA